MPKAISIYLTMLSCLLLSCSKNHDAAITKQWQVKFTAGGNNYDWTGKNDNSDLLHIGNFTYSYYPSSSSTQSWYFFRAITKDTDTPILNNALQFWIMSPVVNTAVYSINNTTQVPYNYASSLVLDGVVYFNTEIGDFVTVTVTSIKDGYASGTFSARMTNYYKVKLDITNGMFTNIKINPAID